MVSLNRLKHKAKLIGCSVFAIDECNSKVEVEKLMKVIDDKIKNDLNPSEDPGDENGSSD